jgi:hypothetical protein
LAGADLAAVVESERNLQGFASSSIEIIGSRALFSLLLPLIRLRKFQKYLIVIIRNGGMDLR